MTTRVRNRQHTALWKRRSPQRRPTSRASKTMETPPSFPGSFFGILEDRQSRSLGDSGNFIFGADSESRPRRVVAGHVQAPLQHASAKFWN